MPGKNHLQEIDVLASIWVNIVGAEKYYSKDLTANSHFPLKMQKFPPQMLYVYNIICSYIVTIMKLWQSVRICICMHVNVHYTTARMCSYTANF